MSLIIKSGSSGDLAKVDSQQRLSVSIDNSPAVSISGSVVVTGTFFQGTQPVSAATLPLPSNAAIETGGNLASIKTDLDTLAGTVAAAKVGVTVSNFPATQPVSASSLPLPSGAATAAKQPALGVAGTPAADVLTIQGAPSMTALKVDGSATTQPVSGTITANAGSGTFLTDSSAHTQPISAGSLPLPSGASTAAKQPAIGTAGTPAVDVITIQGIASMTALKVDGSAVTQPVSVGNFPATQAVSATTLPLPTGAATAAKQPALGVAGTPAADVLTIQGAPSMTALKVDGSATTQPVSVTNFPATQAVSVTALPLPVGASTAAKQPSLGTSGTPSVDVITVQGATSMTALKVDGSAITQPVSAGSLPLPTGASTAAKQPALGVAGTPATDVITVQGVVSMTALKVDGSAVTQPVSAGSLPLPTGAATAAKQPALGTAGTPSVDVITVQGAATMTALKVDGSGVTQPVSGSVSLGTATGKTAVLKTGSLVTTTVTVDQVVLSYTVTAGKTFYLEYVELLGRLTAVSATAAILGAISLETPSGTKVYTDTQVNPTTSDCGSQRIMLHLVEPIPVAATVVIRVVVTPAAVTSTTWFANFGGYEK